MSAYRDAEMRGDPMRQTKSCMEPEIKLNRWLVYFDSGSEWYPVGEFVSTDATSAISRAIEIFGEGAGYRAEEIPWDAAPLAKASFRPAQN